MGDGDLSDALDRMEMLRRRILGLRRAGLAFPFAMVIVIVGLAVAAGRVQFVTPTAGILIAVAMAALGVLAGVARAAGTLAAFPGSPRTEFETITVRASRTCEGCDAIVPLASRKCDRCGRLGAEPFSVLDPEALPAPPRASRRKPTVIAVYIVVLVVASVLFIRTAWLSGNLFAFGWLVLAAFLSALWWAATLAAIKAFLVGELSLVPEGFVPPRIPLGRALRGRPVVRYDEVVFLHLGFRDGKRFVVTFVKEGWFFLLREAGGIPAKRLLELSGEYLRATVPSTPGRPSGAQS